MKKLLVLLLFIPLVSFGQESSENDDEVETIIIIVVSLSVIGIYFWLKSEKEKTIRKQKIKQKLKKD